MRLPLLLLALSIPQFALADDWTTLGRTGDRNPVSLEKNAPIDWDFKTTHTPERNIKWSVQVESGSRSAGGPVVANGFIWVGGCERDDDKKIDNAVLACYRVSDGKLVYRHVSKRLKGFTTDWPLQSLSGSPLIEGDRLWFCNNRREVICLDIAPLNRGGQPTEVWKVDMVQEFKIHPRSMMIPGHDTHGSPAGYKDFLYIPTGNGMDDNNEKLLSPDAPVLVCLRKDTGKTVWTDRSPGELIVSHHYSSPTVVTIAKKAQVIHPQADGWVRSFDAETGKLIWKFDTNLKNAPLNFRPQGKGKPTRNAVVAAPVFANGKVYFAAGRDPESTGDSPGTLFCIDPSKTGDISAELDDGPGQGKANPNSGLIWAFTGEGLKESERMGQSLSLPAIHDGFVISTDFYGVVHCLDEKTGKQHWAHDTRGRVNSGQLVVDGKIYTTTDAGDVSVFELSKTKKLLAKRESDHSVVAPMVFANGVLYLLSEKTLTAIAAKK